MPLYSLPPLDAQTHSIPSDQQPSPRMLLVIALIATCGLSLSWLAHQQPAASAFYPQGPHGPGGAKVLIACGTSR